MDSQDITAIELAKKLKKKESWTYLMLQGKAGRTFKIAEQIAKALGVKDKEIIK
jgi:ribosome-binding protein aMBF1 (putative translation factor)